MLKLFQLDSETSLPTNACLILIFLQNLGVKGL
jgi:hypothetical protein